MIKLDVSRLKHVPGETQRVVLRSELPDIITETERIGLAGPVELDLQLTSTASAIVVRGEARAVLLPACGRCLESFAQPVRAEIEETYYQVGQEDVQPDPEWQPYSGDSIDITGDVIKSLLVALPMRLVCSEDCRGLCPVCGTNLNKQQCNCVVEEIDPRLAALKKLLQ
ncbi:MAG: YceD family protein [Bacillota bacterium]|uniref:YceD family protein n=1 Tax=Desulfurispora thermophila TaxID=265470 RepID=UPI0003650C03|nr:DUF177 domain-containing protein [Desulfurispora thermophila]